MELLHGAYRLAIRVRADWRASSAALVWQTELTRLRYAGKS
jgi:hypothetical protein